MALDAHSDNADLLKDEYESLDPAKCNEVQKLVQRVTKISSFYVKENIELYDIAQRVSLMTGDCARIEGKYEALDKRLKYVRLITIRG